MFLWNVRGHCFTHVRPSMVVASVPNWLRAAIDEWRAGSARLKAVSCTIVTMADRVKGRMLTLNLPTRAETVDYNVEAEDENWHVEPEPSIYASLIP